MKSIILIVFALIVIASAFKDDPDWKEFKKAHKKAYKNDADEGKRFKNFKKNDEKIKAHNEKRKKGENFYTMGHNHFSDMDDEEVKALFPDIPPKPTNRALPQGISPALYPPGPPALSYQPYCMTPLNQAPCGSCWAFASAAQVEAQQKRKNWLFNTRISPQYLLDCAYNLGCIQGGWPSTGLTYMKNFGYASTANYPYVGYKKACSTTVPKMPQGITGVYNYNLNGNEEHLKNILASVGPVVVAMYVDVQTFTQYQSGVYWKVGCPSQCEMTNHAMLLVGYGTDYTTFTSPVNFWLFKNSHGLVGEGGYIRMIRGWTGMNNNCNVACIIDFTT